MNIHRLTTQNLPSIRVHDHQNSYDSTSDHTLSAHSQRSLPRDIPFPKHGSPTSSRGGSFHGSMASNVPPLLPVEPIWDAPPSKRWDLNSRNRDSNPVSPLESFWNGSGSGRSYWGHKEENSSSWGNRRFEDEEQSTRNEFKKLNLAERHKSEESVKKEAGATAIISSVYDKHSLEPTLASGSARDRDIYDKHLLHKLSSGKSQSTSSNLSIHARTARSSTFGPDEMPNGSDFESSRRPIRSATNPIPIPSLSTVEKPLDPWQRTGLESPSANAITGSGFEHIPPVLPVLPFSPSDFRNRGSEKFSMPHFGHGREPNDDNIKRPNSVSLARRPSYHAMRERSCSFNSPKSCGDTDTDSQMEDIPSSNISKLRQLTLETGNSPRPSFYPLMNNPNNHRVGSKRRASSPPNEDRLSNHCDSPRRSYYENGNDLYSRRSPVNLSHPGFRYSPGAPSRAHPAATLLNSPLPRSGSSFASTTSSGTCWSSVGGNSLISAASSFTTHGRNSPATSFSPSSEPDGLSDSLFLLNSSTTHSAANSRRSSRQRTASEVNVVVKQERENTIPKLQKLTGVFICECCPKKPKRFDNEADLQAHAMEKQYTCAYCNNRFKNKNEAERHQNSLHLRKHSWSCAALSGYEAAFHQSPQRPSQADVCGYCGREFSIPANWTSRVEHLTSEHKFGECNQAKKFFRADHFRQHLKHSHSGTAGKWTNVLENACMRDEPGPEGGGGGVELRNAVISEE